MRARLSSIPAALVAFLAIVVATAAGADRTDETARAKHERNLGYGLLHQLLSDLSDADKLLYVKIEPKPVEQFTDRLVTTTKRIDGRIETFAKADPGLRIDETGLPEAEQRARLGIRKTRAHDLAPLVGLSGPEFEREFLLGFQKALDQLRHLTEAVRELDEDRQRREFLAESKREFETLHRDVSTLLARRYFRTAASGRR